MQQLIAYSQHPNVQQIKEKIINEQELLVSLTCQIQQIPAPTFNEAERAAFIEKKMQDVGLDFVAQDKLHNVYGRYPHCQDETLPPIIVSAHSDTVFPFNTDLSITRKGQKLYGPGIGDNSAGVAGILFLARLLIEEEVQVKRPLWFVSNVGEEGLGDLVGMRAVVDRFGNQAKYIVVEGGLFGQLSFQAIGVQRFKILIETEGGHSWGSFGRTSAIHELGKIIEKIASLKVPKNPKTTFNVGVIEGGTSINTIAQQAHMLLDLRSEETGMLEKLVAEVRQIVADADRRNGAKTTITMTQIGNRPAGSIGKDSMLVQQAIYSLNLVGRSRPAFITSSTDCNIPLSQGIESVCVGLTESNNAHRLDEHILLNNLPLGVTQLLYLVMAAAELVDA